MHLLSGWSKHLGHDRRAFVWLDAAAHSQLQRDGRCSGGTHRSRRQRDSAGPFRVVGCALGSTRGTRGSHSASRSSRVARECAHRRHGYPLGPAAPPACVHLTWACLTLALAPSGWTPLHVAASRGFSWVCEALLGLGANLNAVDELGETPESLAVGLRLSECAMWLRRAAAARGFAHFECVPTKIEGAGDCLLAVRGPTAGNVYAPAPDPGTGEYAYLGRFDPETQEFESGASELLGEAPLEEDAAPPWAQPGEEWAEMETILEEVRADGETFLKELSLRLNALAAPRQQPHPAPWSLSLRFRMGCTRALESLKYSEAWLALKTS